MSSSNSNRPDAHRHSVPSGFADQGSSGSLPTSSRVPDGQRVFSSAVPYAQQRRMMADQDPFQAQDSAALPKNSVYLPSAAIAPGLQQYTQYSTDHYPNQQAPGGGYPSTATSQPPSGPGQYYNHYLSSAPDSQGGYHAPPIHTPLDTRGWPRQPTDDTVVRSGSGGPQLPHAQPQSAPSTRNTQPRSFESWRDPRTNRFTDEYGD